jgi:hypothetical protein
MESGLPVLEMWRNSRFLRIGGKILESGSRALLEVANFLRGYNKIFGNRFQGLLVSMDLNLCGKTVLNKYLRMKKADTSNEKFHQEALSALEKYDLVFYTDGV